MLRPPLRNSSLISCHTLPRWLCHRLNPLVTIVSTLFNARTCCDLIPLRVLYKALHSHARPCAANCEAKHSQHYVRNPCTTLRIEFFKRVILCFLSCEVCHALACFFSFPFFWRHAPPIALLCVLHLQIKFGHLIGSSKYRSLNSTSAVLEALGSSVNHSFGGTKDYSI